MGETCTGRCKAPLVDFPHRACLPLLPQSKQKGWGRGEGEFGVGGPSCGHLRQCPRLPARKRTWEHPTAWPHGGSREPTVKCCTPPLKGADRVIEEGSRVSRGRIQVTGIHVSAPGGECFLSVLSCMTIFRHVDCGAQELCHNFPRLFIHFRANSGQRRECLLHYLGHCISPACHQVPSLEGQGSSSTRNGERGVSQVSRMHYTEVDVAHGL